MEGVIARVVRAQTSSVLLTIDEQSQIGAARRSAVSLGQTHGLSIESVGRLAIVVTEAATNIVHHAGHGAMILRALGSGTSAAVEVLALDKGPGIVNIARAMGDGYSTAGTAGQGLGGIRRLAEVFAIHSQRGVGTAVLARVGERAHVMSAMRPPASLDDRLGVICVPLRGEDECGDSWRVIAGRNRIAVLVVDGLGHGPDAASVAETATAAFPRLAGGMPESALAALDTATRGSRGAAVSVAVIDETERMTRFSGVGNVDGRVLSSGLTEHLVPQNGIVGHTMPSLRASSASWPVGARLVLHSDGISARWRADAYPGLLTAHPALLAGVIFRDFARSRDDATVLVLSDVVEETQ
jgi:anti-sigma regulatory factor (Ser/Thr protein kinase)